MKIAKKEDPPAALPAVFEPLLLREWSRGIWMGGAGTMTRTRNGWARHITDGIPTLP